MFIHCRLFADFMTKLRESTLIKFNMKRVAITGLGAITPLGNTVNEFWQNIVAGKSGAGMLTKFDASKFKTRFGCEVRNFNPEEYIEKKELKKYDLFTQYANCRQ